MTRPLTAEEFTFLGDGHRYPFTEDENANITGYGHQDPAAFAAAVNRWEVECGAAIASEEQWTEQDITHRWVTVTRDGEHLHPVPEGTPGATAVTTLWGQR